MPADKDSKKDSKKDEGKQVTIQLPALTLDFGPQFQMRLAIFALAALLFAFSLYLFARSNFAISDAFDLTRLQFSISKLWSLTFLLFVLIYSLSMALVAAYGVGLPKLQAALPLFVLFVLALIISFFFAPYRLAFIAFALALGVCALAASFYDSLSFTNAWSITSKALTALLILAFLFTVLRAGSQKDKYFDLMVGSVTSQAPELIASVAPAGAQQAVNLCAGLIESAQINRPQVEKLFTKGDVSTALEQGGGPLYSALPSAAKTAVTDAAYEAGINRTVAVANKLKTDLATVLKKIDVGKQLQAVNATQLLSPATLRRELQKSPATKLVLDYLPFLTALTVVSIVSIFNFIVHVLATIFAWALAKFVL